MAIHYLQVEADTPLPQLPELSLFKVVILCEMAVTADWQSAVSDYMVRSGCLYMMAWGIECSSWDDAFDWANIFQFDLKDVPEDKSVMTTWHEDETIEEAFHFCKFHAQHPAVSVEDVLIFHITNQDASKEMLELYDKVCF